MGNDLADAIRDELRDALIRTYGTLDVAATRLGIPYKTLYRALTTRGKDRSQSVKLDLVLDIAAALPTPFSTLYSRAEQRAAETRQRIIDDVVAADQNGSRSDHDLAADKHTDDTLGEFDDGETGDGI